MTYRGLTAALAAAAGIFAASAAGATVIDFESGAGGAPIGGDYAGLGATFTNGAYAQCGGGCPPPALGLFASSPDFASPMTVTFSNLQSSVGFVNVTFSSVLAQAFDSSNNLLDSLTDTENGSIASFTLTAPGIKYVTFQQFDPNYGYGIDDLTFAGGVPEPASWAIMLLGFGALGASLRRRRQAVAA